MFKNLVYTEGYMYWTDWGQGGPARIEKAFLDGSGRRTLLGDLGRMNGFTIDYGTNVDTEEDVPQQRRRLYWADMDKKQIGTATTEGADYRVIIKENLPHPFGLTQYQVNSMIRGTMLKISITN
jgi:low density lipoprotein receptor-related protein 5/6